MILESICVGVFAVNCYILGDESTQEALIIDPGADYKRIKRLLDKKRLHPLFIVNTHGHIDHIGCDDSFGIPIYIHQADMVLLKDAKLNLSESLSSSLVINSPIKTLQDNQDIYLDNQIQLRVIHTPGHTPGSISLLLIRPEEKIIFTGDTLFCAGVGRTDFPGASSELLAESIKKRLLVFDDDMVIYPGHGPASSIGRERKNNPFLING